MTDLQRQWNEVFAELGVLEAKAALEADCVTQDRAASDAHVRSNDPASPSRPMSYGRALRDWLMRKVPRD